MPSSRDTILNKLRTARRPFETVAPRPAAYQPVLSADDMSTEALIERFKDAMTALNGDTIVTHGDAETRTVIVDLLRQHEVTHILAWDFAHIPVADLEAEVRGAGITIMMPNTHEDHSPENMQRMGSAGAGLTGADGALAATGTIVLSTDVGKGRIPTVLPPIWIVVVSSEQLFAHMEDWVAHQRAEGMNTIYEGANVAFVTGPSRTGDIEMELVLGVHGPGTVYAVIKDE